MYRFLGSLNLANLKTKHSERPYCPSRHLPPFMLEHDSCPPQWRQAWHCDLKGTRHHGNASIHDTSVPVTGTCLASAYKVGGWRRGNVGRFPAEAGRAGCCPLLPSLHHEAAMCPSAVTLVAWVPVWGGCETEPPPARNGHGAWAGDNVLLESTENFTSLLQPNSPRAD